MPASGLRLEPTVIRSVWERTTRQPGFETFSVDAKGTMINLFDYGRRSEYGWEIELIVPPELGGTLDASNLHAIHWRNARATAAGKR